MSKLTRLKIVILVVWLVIVLFATSWTFSTATQTESANLDMMVQAAQRSKACQESIKQHRVNDLGIDLLPKELDVFETGMLGVPAFSKHYDYVDYKEQFGNLLSISTTDGDLYAKRTSCDPNWAGFIISLFQKAGLKKGDQVGMVFSGSFPSINIACIVAAEVYGLKICVMSGVGASYYGANDPRLTFFDMVEWLNKQGLLSHRIDVISLGGEDDILNNRWAKTEQGKQDIATIKQRIANSSTQFIYETNFVTNMDKRIAILDEKLPNMKFFINVGGTMVGLGSGSSAFTKSGFFKGTKVYSNVTRQPNCGLLQYYKDCGLPVVNLINFRQLSLQNDVPYADDNMPYPPQIGLTEYNRTMGYYSFYYQTSYNPTYAIIALALSVALLVAYFVIKQRYDDPPESSVRNKIVNSD